jgi:hypothetical protein
LRPSFSSFCLPVKETHEALEQGRLGMTFNY